MEEEEYFTHVMPINYVLILCMTQENYLKNRLFEPVLLCDIPIFYPFWSMVRPLLSTDKVVSPWTKWITVWEFHGGKADPEKCIFEVVFLYYCLSNDGTIHK